MFSRVLGGVLLAVGAAILGMAVYALWKSTEMAETMSLGMRAMNQAFNPEDWKKHWVVSSSFMLVLGSGALAGGLTLVRRGVWGYALLAAVMTLNLFNPVVVAIFGGPKYKFEATSYPELLISAGLAIALWWAYARGRRREVVAHGSP